MKQEERLFDLIGNLPDDLTCQTEAPEKRSNPKVPKQRRRWITAAVAACLVVAVGVWGMNSYHPSVTLDDSLKSQPDIVLHGQLNGEKLNWPIISGASSEAALQFTMLPVGERLAEYHQVEDPNSIPKEYRPQYLGEIYEDLDGWYRTADTEGLRYLVNREKFGSYTLWEFSHFVVYDEETLEEMKNAVEQGELTHLAEFIDRDYSPYTYGEVLETIYGVTSAEDLVSVTVDPANMDNTDAGKKLQKKIGSFLTAKRDDLNALYEALANMTCYGSNHWDLIDLGDNSNDEGLLTSVRLCRYLTIETADGVVIDDLKYSAAGGQFYEYSGIAYEPLTSEAAAKMNKIFDIDVS